MCSPGVLLVDRRWRDAFIRRTTSVYVACSTLTHKTPGHYRVIASSLLVSNRSFFFFQTSGPLFPALWRQKQIVLVVVGVQVTGAFGHVVINMERWTSSWTQNVERRLEHRTLNVVINAEHWTSSWPQNVENCHEHKKMNVVIMLNVVMNTGRWTASWTQDVERRHEHRTVNVVMNIERWT